MKNFNKVVCIMLTVIMYVSCAGTSAWALDIDDLVPDCVKSGTRDIEVMTKEMLISMGFDAPEGNVDVYDILTWNEADNAAAYEDLEIAEDQSVFPREVIFRDNNGGYNGYYDFKLYEGVIYIKKRETDDAWRVMPMPDDLKGRIVRFSIDTHGLIAVDESNWVYKAQNLLDDTTEWYWMTACGGLMDISPWYKLVTSDEGQWALSCTDSDYDVTYTDSYGNIMSTGGSGCTNIYYVNPDNTTEIIYDDPWLPNDESRAIASPKHGTFQIESMSAASSTIFVTNKYGDMYTIMHDFDISGGDELFFDYTWNSNTEGLDITEILDLAGLEIVSGRATLPSEDWCQQPKIDGTITDKISIVSLGNGSENRLLRVEGMKNGKTGYFEKNLYDGVIKQETGVSEAGRPAENGEAEWTFVETGEPLQGNILNNSLEDTSDTDLVEETGINFSGKLYNATMTVTDFNYAASYQTATITVGEGENAVTVPATLYMEYGNLGTATSMTILPHEPGFTASARLYIGAVYLDAEAYTKLQSTEEGKKFTSGYMQEDNIRSIALAANTEMITMTEDTQFTQYVLVGACYQLERIE